MHRGKKYLASLSLSAALLAPTGGFAMPVPQDDRDHERHEAREGERRVYDPYHRDYHNWDQREDQVYRRWLDEQHESYVDYERLRRKQRRAYWNWRHSHEEHERMDRQ
jgi:hypothetical protein